MKLNPNALKSHLSSQAAPIYLLYGEEPLQLMELGEQLREYARVAGFEERQVLFASKDEDWTQFREAANSHSLFAERRLIELRMPTGKPGRAGAEVLKQYCESPSPDVLLIITSDKLERSATNSAWFKALDKAGVTVPVWPIASAQLGQWLQTRLAKHGLNATSEAVGLIAERVEGNMLAANQEVERLALLYPLGEHNPQGKLSRDQVLEAVADSARYSINDLVQAALNGKATRAIRIVRGLREEAVAPVLVLWSLTQEVRSATRAAEAYQQGASLDAALKSAGVWPSRAAPLKAAIGRHTSADWLSMLSACSELDRLVKGQATGDPWDAFELLCLHLAGHGQEVLPQATALL